jgi:hypothetical protein
MKIDVQWTLLGDRDDRWSDSFCLYAYLHPIRDWVLYIGKSDYSTIRRRLRGDHKSQLFRDIRHRYLVDAIRVLHGEVQADLGYRRSSALLADVESLLIMRLQPFANICATQSRTSRPGLRVFCSGHWPIKRDAFHDI